MLKRIHLSTFDAVIILLSIILYIGIVNAPFKAKPFGDRDFHIETKTISQFFWGRSSFEKISITKAPGPVLFYLIPYMVAGPDASEDQYWLAGILWTGLFMTLSLFLLKAACVHIGYERAGKIVIILLLILPLHIYYGLGILAEGMGFISCAVMVYGWSLLTKDQFARKGFVFYAVGMVGLIASRPNAGLIIPLICVYYLWKLFFSKSETNKIFTRKILLTTGFSLVVIVILFYAVKNLPGSRNNSQEGYLLHVAQHGRFQFREETWDWRFWDNDSRNDSRDYQNQVKTKLHLDSLVKEGEPYTSVYTQWLIKDILNHPITALKQFFVRILSGHTLMINSVDPSSFKAGPLKGAFAYYAFIVFLNLFNWGFILLGAIYFIFFRRSYDYFPLLVIWLALVIFSAALYMEQRYLFPARPIFVFCAALALGDLVGRLRGRFGKDA